MALVLGRASILDGHVDDDYMSFEYVQPVYCVCVAKDEPRHIVVCV